MGEVLPDMAGLDRAAKRQLAAACAWLAGVAAGCAGVAVLSVRIFCLAHETPSNSLKPQAGDQTARRLLKPSRPVGSRSCANPYGDNSPFKLRPGTPADVPPHPE